MSEVRESTIEAWLFSRVQGMGGWCIKITTKDWPDRIILLPGGVIGFLELKRPGKEPREEQLHILAQLKAAGFVAGWANTRATVALFLAALVRRQRQMRQKAPRPLSASRRAKKT